MLSSTSAAFGDGELTARPELRHTVANLFEEKLREEGLAQYTHCLLPNLFARFRRRSPTELEAAALLDSADNGNYGQYGWADALESIDPRDGERARVEAWLKAFFTVVLPVAFPRFFFLSPFVSSRCPPPLLSDLPRNTPGCR